MLSENVPASLEMADTRSRRDDLDKFSGLIVKIYCSWHRPKPFSKVGFLKLPFWSHKQKREHGKSRRAWHLRLVLSQKPVKSYRTF